MSQDQVQDVRSVFSTGCLVFCEYAGFQNALTYFPQRGFPGSSYSELEEEERRFQVWAGHALCLKRVTLSVKQQSNLRNWCFLRRSSLEDSMAPKQEWLEILLKYGCLINQKENSFTKIPIVQADRWLAPPYSPLRPHRAAWKAKSFLWLISYIHQRVLK